MSTLTAGPAFINPDEMHTDVPDALGEQAKRILKRKHKRFTCWGKVSF